MKRYEPQANRTIFIHEEGDKPQVKSQEEKINIWDMRGSDGKHINETLIDNSAELYGDNKPIDKVITLSPNHYSKKWLEHKWRVFLAILSTMGYEEQCALFKLAKPVEYISSENLLVILFPKELEKTLGDSLLFYSTQLVLQEVFSLHVYLDVRFKEN